MFTIKKLSTSNLFDLKYNIFPSIGVGITDNVFNGSINLHYDMYSNIELLFSRRFIEKGLGVGGGSNTIIGNFLGVRYKFN